MKGRPKKQLDAKILLELHGQGLSSRAIAKRIGISYKTVQRRLGQKSESGTKTRTTTITSDKWDKNTGTKIPAFYLDLIIPYNNTPPAYTPFATFSLSDTLESDTEERHIGFYKEHYAIYTIRYKGEVNEGTVYTAGNIRNPYKFRIIERKNARIDARPKTMIVRVNRAVLPALDDTDKLDEIAKGIALQELGELSERNSITYHKETFKRIQYPHYVEQPILVKADAEAKQITYKTGVLLGDSSDPDKIEFVGEMGKIRAKTLLWLLDELPEIIIKEHKELMDELHLLKNLLAGSIMKTDAKFKEIEEKLNAR